VSLNKNASPEGVSVNLFGRHPASDRADFNAALVVRHIERSRFCGRELRSVLSYDRMAAPRSKAKATPAPKGTDGGRAVTPEPGGARRRKRKALERFVDKNAKVLAELAK
jgi:hypothetical protein